jgi:hypothetical protein
LQRALSVALLRSKRTRERTRPPEKTKARHQATTTDAGTFVGATKMTSSAHSIYQESDPLELHRLRLTRARPSALVRCADLVSTWEREAVATNDLDGAGSWAFIQDTIDDELARRRERDVG